MEWERFDLLPSSRHAREFLRSYAELLGLDPQQFVRHYEAAFTREEPDEPPRRRRRIVLMIMLAAAPLAALALGAAWQLLLDEPEEARAPARISPTRAPPAPAIAKPARPKPPARPAAPGARAKVVPPTRVTVAAVRGDSWMEARSGGPSGALLYRGNLGSGRSVRLRSRRVWIRLGAASNVDVTVNGRRVGRSLFGTVDVTFTRRDTQSHGAAP